MSISSAPCQPRSSLVAEAVSPSRDTSRSRILSICTGMGLMDRAFLDEGFDIVPGCEIDSEMRAIYTALCGARHMTHDIADLIDSVRGQSFGGIIGGPPCQAHTRLRAIRAPKFPDLTPLVNRLLETVIYDWYVLENVCPLALPDAHQCMLNAMHYYKPHQSRFRWFTYRGVLAPPPRYHGDVDQLRAYPVVAGRIYGPRRGAWLQGYDSAANLPFKCAALQRGLANAVPYPLARAWAQEVKRMLNVSPPAGTAR
jgi:site-specific DNA-cytosine methylase